MFNIVSLVVRLSAAVKRLLALFYPAVVPAELSRKQNLELSKSTPGCGGVSVWAGQTGYYGVKPRTSLTQFA